MAGRGYPHPDEQPAPGMTSVPEGLPAIRDDLDQVADALAGTLDDVRELGRGVHPAILAEAGLGTALRGLARCYALPVRLQVSDDGVGGADVRRGSGLTGIRDRVEAVGGTVAVHSPSGSGTVLTACLPVGNPVG
jgi:signal transduction histidine kinase